MASDVTIGGKKFPKWGVYASVIGGIGVVGYVIYRKHQADSTAANSSTSSASSIDPTTGLPYSEDNTVDPATGMTYLEEAQEYGSVAAAEAAVEGQDEAGLYSGSAYTDAGGTLEEVPYSDISGSETGTNYTSNAEWAQAAEAGLSDIGYASTDVSAALGRYLANLSLTPDQATIVYAAIAEYGPPPVGSFQVILAPTTTTTTTGTGTGTTATGRLPNVSGLHASAVYTNSAQVEWSPVAGATGYTAECKEGGDNGATVSGPFSVSNPVANFGGLKSKTKYTALIWPGDGKNVSQPHAECSFTTK